MEAQRDNKKTWYTRTADPSSVAISNNFVWHRAFFYVGRVWKCEKNSVSLCWTGSPTTAVLRRDPTTARHGYFWLLGRPPGPVRTSLDNLATPDSSGGPILMPGLVRTPDRHRPPLGRTPALKRSTSSRLRVAGLQERATAPSGRESVAETSSPGTVQYLINLRILILIRCIRFEWFVHIMGQFIILIKGKGD